MKKAFTLSEMITSLSILILIVVLVMPVLKNTLRNVDRPRIKQAYAQVLTVTKYMTNNITAYPNAGKFADTSARTVKGLSYSGGSKFADLFKSQLNLVDDRIAYPLNASLGNISIFCNAEASSQTSGCKIATAANTTCFQTSNNTTYCLPKDTTIDGGFSAAADNLAIVQIYFNEEYKRETGYYVGISKIGKVSTVDPKLTLGAAVDCGDNNIYKNYNACKIDDYLSTSKD